MSKLYEKEWTYRGHRCRIMRDEGYLDYECVPIYEVQTGLRCDFEHMRGLPLIFNGRTPMWGVDEEGWCGVKLRQSNVVCVDENREKICGMKSKEDAHFVYDEDDVVGLAEKLVDHLIVLEDVVHRSRERSSTSFGANDEVGSHKED